MFKIVESELRFARLARLDQRLAQHAGQQAERGGRGEQRAVALDEDIAD